MLLAALIMLSSLLLFLSGWGGASAFTDVLAFALCCHSGLLAVLSSSRVIGLVFEPLGYPLGSVAFLLLLGFSSG